MPEHAETRSPLRPEDFGPGSYSEDKSPWCDSWNREAHKHCSGRFTLFEMDYINMTCACYCHTYPQPNDGPR